MRGLKISGMRPLLQVFDMPTSVRFYTEVLGFEVVETEPTASRSSPLSLATTACGR